MVLESELEIIVVTCIYSCVYTRVLTRVQLTSGREPIEFQSITNAWMWVESILVTILVA